MIQQPSHPCPACNGPTDAPFFRLPGVPLQSNLLLTTQAEALSIPTGELALAFCTSCGLITNTAFDFASQELSAKYEASQGFSATFNAFTAGLAKRWGDRFGLAGKTAVEIGCGKGEFLATLCKVAGCRGVGFDPTLDPARLPDADGLDIVWRPELFTEATAADLGADFVCCRHTLEHIPDVAGFLGMLRRAIGGRRDVGVGFEVPDTLRVLTEGAFWDVYYEHCSYFTAGSLARAFARAGFDVLDVRREYDGQYLVMEAVPGTNRLSIDDVAELRDAVRAFAARSAATIRRWRGVIEAANAAGKTVAVWGASSKAVGFLSALGYTREQIPLAVDINPHKQGSFLPTSGVPIVSPASLRDRPADVVILMNPIYRKEIAADLDRLGVRAEVLAL